LVSRSAVLPQFMTWLNQVGTLGFCFKFPGTFARSTVTKASWFPYCSSIDQKTLLAVTNAVGEPVFHYRVSWHGRGKFLSRESSWRRGRGDAPDAVTRGICSKNSPPHRVSPSPRLPLTASPPRRVFLLLIPVPDRLDLASEFQQLVPLICRWFVEQNGDVT